MIFLKIIKALHILGKIYPAATDKMRKNVDSYESLELDYLTKLQLSTSSNSENWFPLQFSSLSFNSCSRKQEFNLNIQKKRF